MAALRGQPTETIARIEVVENAIVRLDRSMQNLAEKFGAYLDDQSKVRRGPPFKEIIVSILATLGVIGFAFDFLEGQYGKNTKPLEQRIERLETIIEKKFP